MRVTRSWLSEFIDLSGVSNETLYETFNSIGLEVDSLTQIEIDSNVVIGKILSCEKHPDADKLNVCQIDVGTGTRQIVCGASNVVDAEYVAVAMLGAVLPDGLIIKDAVLRGVESAGMVCASSELGLPDLGKGIMILDKSMGKLEIGKALTLYPRIADTLIELELTANRGDCLSIYGVARDLSVALGIELKPFEYKEVEKMKLGIAREADLRIEGKMEADLHYKLATIENTTSNILVRLRLAMVEVEAEDTLDALLAYATHTTGVVLRAYNSRLFRDGRNKVAVRPRAKAKGVMEVVGNETTLSLVGMNQEESSKANTMTTELLLEASYIHPDTLVESVFEHNLKTDTLYYKTSRGSNPDLVFGLTFLGSILSKNSDISCYEGSLNVNIERENQSIIVDIHEISDIIGMELDISKIVMTLQKLGFSVNSIGNDTLVVVVPVFRHDIQHIQDVAEEIVRIIGINNIVSKPFVFAEKPRLNATTNRYHFKKALRNRAVGMAFYENVSYVFSDKSLLEKYGFSTVDEALELSNPIAEELNTLRSTVLINLLLAVKRNSSHSLKSIPLFEIGTVFGRQRQEREVISFVFSGATENENIANAGKPKMIDFASFVQKVGGVVGAFSLVKTTVENGLIHPYQSADIVIGGQVCGFLSKLHPTVQEAFDIPETFIAEISFDALLPKHINAKPISKFQGVYKDLSIVIDKKVPYSKVARILNALEIPLLKERYPVDIYEDEKLGDKKSLTLRFFIQSLDKTLEETESEKVLSQIMMALELGCKAELR